MAYLYRHIRLDTNVPFYVGIGRDKHFTRARNSINRNRYWYSIVNKTKYEVEVMMDDLSVDEAMIKEIEFISLYGRADLMQGTLVNLTDGGEGCSGRTLTTEQVKAAIERFRTLEARAKKSQNMMGNKRSLGYRHTDDIKKKISDANKGLKRTVEQNESNRKRNMGNRFFLGKTHTQETKDKMRQLNLEGKIGRRGKPVSQEARDNISKGLKGRIVSDETKDKIKLSKVSKRKPIRQLSTEGNLIKEWCSISEAARVLGISKGDIIKVCKGYVRSHGYTCTTSHGYKWEYIN